MKKFWNKRIGVVATIVIVAVAPLLLQRPEAVSRSEAEESLVVITPHNETIRSEFAQAFSAYWEKKTGKKVYVDWRTPGGTSEIRMVLDSKFARAGDSEGVGVDVFFGGGDYVFEQQAKKGRFMPLEVFKQHPDWFKGEGGIPQVYTGEKYYSAEKLWVGVCLSQFGICYNVDVLERLGIEAPETWDDLGDPRYFGTLALADPSKSGSVARAFEMLVQQKIHQAIAQTRREPGETEAMRRQRAIRYGWADGLNLIQKISANARYFTDAATKIPHDVAQGDASAGMCIDFYGRAYNEKLKKADGSSRLQWVAPEGGTSLSVDPVAIFRGAPNEELAQGFVEFLLSDSGQLLWNTQVGAPGGPKRRALRRMPIRPAVYSPKNLAHFTDPEVLPFEKPPLFIYQPEITGPVFGALRYVIKSMCIDAHKELQAAWAALIENDMPEHTLDHFHDVSYVSYIKAMGEIRAQLKSGDKLESAEIAKRMTGVFRRNYKETASLAEEEGK
ncbi:ABC transporter substrate-binding protein [Rubritalea tangerina]|uniref:ABC transporter substrate-binding protein n=1 Tax=Rubritalea tangerina TaxID=430798 RepID=A0ABW4ZCU2_9BACT